MFVVMGLEFRVFRVRGLGDLKFIWLMCKC